MKKTKTTFVTTLSIALVLAIILLTSYAFWKVKDGQSGSNTILGSCLNFEFIELEDDNQNPIGGFTLTNAVPVSDEEGSSHAGYTFKVENTCTDAVNYQVVLESLKIMNEDTNTYYPEGKYFADDKIKVQLDSGAIKTYSSYAEVDNDSAAANINEIRKTRELYTGTIPGGETITHNMKMWISSESTEEDVEKIFRSKIEVIAGQEIEVANGGEIASPDDVEYIMTYFLGEPDSQTGERPRNVGAMSKLVPSNTPLGYGFDDDEIVIKRVEESYPDGDRSTITISYKGLTFEVLLNAETAYFEEVTRVRVIGGEDSDIKILGENCDINTIGCEVEIGTERFYVLGSSGSNNENVKLLSRFNLLVGNAVNPNNNTVTETYTSSTKGYNLQSAKALGNHCNESQLTDSNNNIIAEFTPGIMVAELKKLTVSDLQSVSSWKCLDENKTDYIGVVAYAQSSSAFSGYANKSYVYYSGVIPYEYVNNYKDILEEDYDIDIISAQLISKEEVDALFSEASYEAYYQSIINYSWLFSTSYWTGTYNNGGDMYGPNGGFGLYNVEYNNAKNLGVRPVIEVAKSMFN